MKSISKAMVLAAGFGLRARPLTLVRPKPLFPCLTRPLIGHVLEDLARIGVEEVVVNVHHLADQVEAFLAEPPAGLKLKVLREPEILGVGGGLKNAEKLLDSGTFILINSDIYTEIDLKALVRAHFESRAWATLALHDYPKFNQVAVGLDGKIKGFRGSEKPEPGQGGLRKLAFTGVHVIDPDIFDLLPPGPGDIIPWYQKAIEQGRPPAAFEVDNLLWHDAGTLAGYLELHRELLSRSGSGPVFLGPGAKVHPGAEIRGWAALMSGAEVENEAVVENSILWPGASAASGALVSGSVLADGVRAEGLVKDRAVVETGPSGTQKSQKAS